MAEHDSNKKPTRSEPFRSGNHNQQYENLNSADFADDMTGDVISHGAVQRAGLNIRSTRPQEVLQLQRMMGNRAVAGLLGRTQSLGGNQASTSRPPIVQAKLMVGPANDRYEQEADAVADRVMRMSLPAGAFAKNRVSTQGLGAKIARRTVVQRTARGEGFETDDTFQRSLGHTKGRGRTLPNDTRSFMEQRFQRSFADVRIHTGHDAVQMSRDIQAKAFTHQNHIYFNSGAYAPGTDSGKHLLAHELTHVVQQTGALQRSPEGIIQRKGLFSRLREKFSKKKPEDTSGKIEKSEETTSDSPEAGLNQPTPDLSLEDARAFERKLGSYGLKHPRTTAAAKTMIDKMTSVMIKDFDDKNQEHRKKVAEIYGKDNIHSAGQVGTDVEAVMGVLKEGNVRERMTALMNAMFGPFKMYIQQIFNESAWSEAQSKGLDVKKLKRRKRQKRWNAGAVDIYRDPGNPLDRKKFSSWQSVGNTRTKNDGVSNRTVGNLEDEGIGLSEREIAHQYEGKGRDEIDSNDTLKWQEGGTFWSVNHKNKWVKKVENSLHMPVVAGPSGTMLRMFQAWEFLNKPVPAADWRLAVMSWMLSANDHSFHEMMLTAADYGLPYTPGQMAYLNINPLSLMELREYVAVDKLFPHEHAFERQVVDKKIKHLMSSQDLDRGDYRVKKLNRAEKGAISDIGAAAIDLYSRHGYLTLNPARKGGKSAQFKIWKNIKKKDELDNLKEDYDDGKLTISDLVSEAKSIIPVLDSALEMLPDWNGSLYRGTGTFNPFSYGRGSKIRFGAYTSATLDESTAKGFADNFNVGPFKYILHLKTFAGKDIRKLAAYSEDEILIPAGSEFTVTDRKAPKSGRRYYEVFMEQTKRGGSGLKLKPDDDVMMKDEQEDSQEEVVDSGGSKPVFVPTIKSLKVYDGSETEQDEFDSASSINNMNVGSGVVGDDGVTFWVEIATQSGLYWVKAEELEGFTGFTHPSYLEHKIKNGLVTGPSDTSSVGSSPVVDSPSQSQDSGSSSGGGSVKKSPLVYYDDIGESDTIKMLEVGAINSPDTITDKDVSKMTDTDGTVWIQISDSKNGMHWVKQSELNAFIS